MLRAMVRFNVTPGKRLNNPPSDDSAFEVHLRFDSEAQCVAYADMRPWPNRPVQQTVPLGSENFQLHIVEVALQQFVRECSGTRRRPSTAIKRAGADLGDESRSRAWHVDGVLIGASQAPPAERQSQSPCSPRRGVRRLPACFCGARPCARSRAGILRTQRTLELAVRRFAAWPVNVRPRS
jgi:hypothetical protein